MQPEAHDGIAIATRGPGEDPAGAGADQRRDSAATRFRPQGRPPVGVLWIMDDDQQSAEPVRIRQAPLVIGRSEGDVLIPHDGQISSRHAEVQRVEQEGDYAWYLADLQSTNGTFVKVAQARLADGAEFRVGGARFCFFAGPPPSLQPLTPDGEGESHLLERDEQWIGRDGRRCLVACADDPAMAPQHARIYRDAQDHWFVADGGSLDGTWLRVERLRLVHGSEFELGEQRFRITFP